MSNGINPHHYDWNRSLEISIDGLERELEKCIECYQAADKSLNRLAIQTVSSFAEIQWTIEGAERCGVVLDPVHDLKARDIRNKFLQFFQQHRIRFLGDLKREVISEIPQYDAATVFDLELEAINDLMGRDMIQAALDFLTSVGERIPEDKEAELRKFDEELKNAGIRHMWKTDDGWAGKSIHLTPSHHWWWRFEEFLTPDERETLAQKRKELWEKIREKLRRGSEEREGHE